MVSLLYMLFVGYALLIFSFAYGWFRLPQPTGTPRPRLHVSVIIAFRNEASNLPRLLNYLYKQDYPAEKMNFIFVDDHSTDRSVEILCKENRAMVKLFQLPENKIGKKSALQMGTAHATGDILLFTDADCRMGNCWVSSYVQKFTTTHAKMVIGPVSIGATHWWGKVQAIEFISLAMSAAGAVGIRRPIMCNAANLGIRRQTYLDHQQALKKQYASGDDMFLLQAIKQNDPTAIAYLKSKAAIVITDAKDTLTGFLQQRQRWAGKAVGYTDLCIVGVALLVFVVNLGLLCAYVFLPWVDWLALFMLKSAADFLLLAQGAVFYGQKKILWLFVPLQVMYPVYVLVSVVGSLWPVRWKGRTI